MNLCVVFTWFKSGCLDGVSLESKSASCSKYVVSSSTHSKIESKCLQDFVVSGGVSSNSIGAGCNDIKAKSNATNVVADETDLPSKDFRKRGPKRGPRGLRELLKSSDEFHQELFSGENIGIGVSSPNYKRWLRGVNYRQKRWDHIKSKYPTVNVSSTAESNDIGLKNNVEESNEKLPNNSEVSTPNIPCNFEVDLVIISSDEEDV